MTVLRAPAAVRYQAITDLLAAEGRVDVVDIANRLGVARKPSVATCAPWRAPESYNACTAARSASSPVHRLFATASPRSHRMTLSCPAGYGRTAASRHNPAWHRNPDARSCTCHRRRPTGTRGLTIVTNSSTRPSCCRGPAAWRSTTSVEPCRRSLGHKGDWAVREMERLHVDVSVVCPAGISIERGLTQATPAAAAVSQVEWPPANW